jgi:hypothetical protein
MQLRELRIKRILVSKYTEIKLGFNQFVDLIPCRYAWVLKIA